MSRYTRNISSRLGRYERPRFGESGSMFDFGPGFDLGFESDPVPGVGVLAPDYDPATGEAVTPDSGATDADSGTDWGAVGGFVTGLIGAFAPIGIGIWQSQQQKDAAEKARKREQARLAEMARQRALMPGYAPPPPKSKAGLVIGLSVAALAIVGVIILVVKKKGR